MLRLAAAAILMASATPAFASDWVYVTSAKDLANITFIDKDSIRATDSGTLRYSMFSVFAKPDEKGGSAFRFELETNCTRRQSRMVGFEIFDTERNSQAAGDTENDWEPVDRGGQGTIIANFVCGGGKPGPENISVGEALPFGPGKAMLADMARGRNK